MFLESATAAVFVVATALAGPVVASAQTPCRTSDDITARAACYRVVLSQIAGTDVSLDSLYSEAVQQRQRLLDALHAPIRALLGDGVGVVDGLRRVRSDDRYVMHDPDSILAAYRREVPRARAASGALFTPIADVALTVQSIPQAQASVSAPAAYSASNERTAPLLLVNAYQPGGIAAMNVPFGVAHEAYPGHHWQALYAQANGKSAFAGQRTMAFVEGWGIYAEQAGDEAGLYDTPLTRIGYLTHLLDVFVALQVDIGVHARGWSVREATDSMMTIVGRSDVQADQYARRHVATPGQLASYAIGFSAITHARESAAAALGARFDVRAFHDAVLREGASTLPEMTRRVRDWTTTARGSSNR
jgi:uncharacterized protein (DUF885 family)